MHRKLLFSTSGYKRLTANIFDYENDGKVKKCEVELQYEIFKNNLKISFIDNETGEIRQREIRGFM